jgi:hypothetical protein
MMRIIQTAGWIECRRIDLYRTASAKSGIAEEKEMSALRRRVDEFMPSGMITFSKS